MKNALRPLLPLGLVIGLYIGVNVMLDEQIRATTEELLESMINDVEGMAKSLNKGFEPIDAEIEVTRVFLDGNRFLDSLRGGYACVSLGGQRMPDVAVEVRGNGVWEDCEVHIDLNVLEWYLAATLSQSFPELTDLGGS